MEVLNPVSKFADISCEIPKGLVLEPLLFLIYMKDWCQAVESEFYMNRIVTFFPHCEAVCKIKRKCLKILVIYVISLQAKKYTSEKSNKINYMSY